MGGVLYVIFWTLFISMFVPKPSTIKITTIVFSLTCIIEFIQLWHTPFLTILRDSFIGKTILGTTFSWLDFIHYMIGYILSIALLHWVTIRENLISD